MIQERAIVVALGLVYYMRLNDKYRKKYANDLRKTQIYKIRVDEALKEEVCICMHTIYSVDHSIYIHAYVYKS